MRILLTGASGFVGQHFVAYCPKEILIEKFSFQSQLLEDVRWEGIDTVVHLAGKAHDLKHPASPDYHRVNTELTRKLANASKAAGVRHFIFVSTIKVYGNKVDRLLAPETPCVPDDDYGISKRNAEIYLQSIESADFTVSIVRPPLIYGAGVKGNMARLIALADSDRWLPLGGISNRRTMVFTDNLNALLMQLIRKRPSGIFLAGDADSVSTTRLMQYLRIGLNRPERLFAIPGGLRWLLRKAVPHLYTRLFGSLELDTSATQLQLDFIPPFSTEEGIQQMLSK